MHKQEGLTLSGFLLWAIVICFALLLAFKIGPPYLEYLTIKRHFQAIAKDPDAKSGQRRDIETAFMKRTMVEDVKSITGKDLVITKEADGVVISAEYTSCNHVVGNIRACMDFAPSSKK